MRQFIKTVDMEQRVYYVDTQGIREFWVLDDKENSRVLINGIVAPGDKEDQRIYTVFVKGNASVDDADKVLEKMMDRIARGDAIIDPYQISNEVLGNAGLANILTNLNIPAPAANAEPEVVADVDSKEEKENS